jgi:protein CpxP
MKNKLGYLALAGVLTLGLSSTTLFAQDGPPPMQQGQAGGYGAHRAMNPDQQLKHLSRALNLSSDQQSQLKPILEEQDQKMQALWQDQSLSRQDRHSKMMDLRQERTSKIESVLNDQQKQKFEQMQQERMQRMQERNGGGGEQQPQPQM